MSKQIRPTCRNDSGPEEVFSAGSLCLLLYWYYRSGSLSNTVFCSKDISPNPERVTMLDIDKVTKCQRLQMSLCILTKSTERTLYVELSRYAKSAPKSAIKDAKAIGISMVRKTNMSLLGRYFGRWASQKPKERRVATYLPVFEEMNQKRT